MKTILPVIISTLVLSACNSTSITAENSNNASSPVQLVNSTITVPASQNNGNPKQQAQAAATKICQGSNSKGAKITSEEKLADNGLKYGFSCL